ncbi:MAG TPA: hypothetical protein VHF69_02370 [Candidatus Synoicihabitans sp.]|nr:hypothetical protein [Candidatus Synoicihabitans sp.]
MKILRLLLVLSVLANFALAVGLALRRPVWSVARDEQSNPPGAASAEAPVATEPLHWDDLRRLDDAAYLQHLRTQGWPRRVIRALVAARLDREYAPQRKAILLENPVRYWQGKSGQFFPQQASAATRARLRQLNWEQHSRLVGLLADEANDPSAEANTRRRYGPIAPEKAKHLTMIELDYHELIEQAREAAGGVMLAEDREVIRMLEAERDADMAQLLTPEEKHAYDLRTSPTAVQLRFRLAGFDPSEEEYVAIHQLQKALDDQFRHANSSPELHAQRQAAQEEVNRQIAAVLGEERYRDYEITTHSSWRQTDAWAKQQQLPETATRSLTVLTMEINQRREALSQDRSLSAAERAARQTALHQEATLRLAQVLPAHQIESYQKGPGRWLQTLQPRQR